MKRKMSNEKVLYVADLAHLYLSSEEVEVLSEQLSDIVEHIDHLAELNVEHVQPMTHILPARNVFRDDVKKSSLPQGVALQNAPGKEKGFFTVPRVI